MTAEAIPPWFELTPAQATVDLGAYVLNLAAMRSRVAPAELMAVVKADAYGHGLVRVARTAVAAGIHWLGSLDIDTALRLRAEGVGEETAVFAWLLGPDEDYRAAVEAGVDLGVSTLRQLDEIAAAGAPDPARVHLKIDTGLHRNGASERDWPALVTRALELEATDRVELIGLWTHIAEASEREDSRAIERFHAAIAVAQSLGAEVEVRHLAASAAAYQRADARFDLVRIGAFGYGIAPGGGVSPADLGLMPVLTLTAPVYAVDGGRAEIAIGFGDGISSAVAGRVGLAIRGVRLPIVAIGVDSLSAEIGGALIERGDLAYLFGSGEHGEATLQEWADDLGTIGEELVTRLSPRIPRRYVGP